MILWKLIGATFLVLLTATNITFADTQHYLRYTKDLEPGQPVEFFEPLPASETTHAIPSYYVIGNEILDVVMIYSRTDLTLDQTER